MATARDIVTRALKRASIIASDEAGGASDADDALAALNDMMFAWAAHGIDCLHSTMTLGSTFVFFVPPAALEPATIEVLSYQGTWDASANSPTLASATGTEGYVYKVTVAGSTALDDVTSWSVDDYAVYDGTEWLKGKSSARHQQAVVALLTKRLCNDYGKAVPAQVEEDARSGWYTLQGDFVRPPVARVDNGLRNMPSLRYFDVDA